MPDTDALIETHEDTTAPRPIDRDRLETAEERRKRYRDSLVSRQTGKGVRLKPWLLLKKQHFRLHDAEARRKHLQQADMMFRYFDGDMYVEYNAAGQLERLDAEGDFRYVVPVMNGHVGEAFMQLLKVRPEWVVTAKDAGDVDRQRLALMCEELGTDELDRLMGEDERQTESLNSVLTGNSLREIVWSANPKSPKTAKRVEQRQTEVQVPGGRECLNDECRSDVPDGADACPACGLTGIRDIPAGVSVTFEAVETEVELGENMLRIPHPMAPQFDLGCSRFEDSTFIVIHDTLYRHAAAWDYQTLVGDPQAGFSVEAEARASVDRAAVQSDANVGSSRAWRAADWNKVERERHFWKPSEYGQMYCEVEEQLPSAVPDPFYPGQMTDKIPAGTILGDFFPEGAYVTYLGDTVIDIQPVDTGRRFVAVVYGKRPGSAVGTGAKLIALLNDIVNDDYNLYHAVKATSARPFTVVAGESVKLLPEAGQFLRIDRLPPGVSDIRAAIAQYPGQSVAGMDATAMSIQQAMQFIFGTYTLGPAGAPDAQGFGGTATEVTARVEQASGRQIGPIGQRIAADRETMLIALENIRDYSAPEQRKEVERRFGPDITALFFSCDIRRELDVRPKPNTDIPRSLAMTQAGRLAFAQAAGQMLQFADQSPWVMEFLEGLADAYGFPVSLGPDRNDRREAEYRLNRLRAIEERLSAKNPELAANPMEAAKAMYAALEELCGPLLAPHPDDLLADAPRVFMQNHQAFMDAYYDDLCSEKARGYSQGRRLVVIKLWEDHFFAQLEQKEEMTQLQQKLAALLNPPPATPPAPPPDPQALAAAQDDQDERDVARGVIEHHANEAAKQADHTREQEAKDADLERQMTLESHKAQQSIAVAQAKAPPQPGAAQG